MTSHLPQGERDETLTGLGAWLGSPLSLPEPCDCIASYHCAARSDFSAHVIRIQTEPEKAIQCHPQPYQESLLREAEWTQIGSWAP